MTVWVGRWMGVDVGVLREKMQIVLGCSGCMSKCVHVCVRV